MSRRGRQRTERAYGISGSRAPQAEWQLRQLQIQFNEEEEHRPPKQVRSVSGLSPYQLRVPSTRLARLAQAQSLCRRGSLELDLANSAGKNRQLPLRPLDRCFGRSKQRAPGNRVFAMFKEKRWDRRK